MDRPSTSTLGAVAISATGAIVAAREHQRRRAAERFAAAAFETLLEAIDANDAETGAHVRRVAAYALILAEAAELDEATQRSVERVALFHDIGKIHSAIYDIVHDDARLTAEERQRIATHPRRGAEVLAALAPFYPDLPEGVLAHHERWDGSGYPCGLRGRRIPLTARIVAIADTYDAITRQRRYRPARSQRRAVELMLAGRGTQFDSELLDLFLFPPVLDRVRRAERELRRAAAAPKNRRRGRAGNGVSDVSFRWRREAFERRTRDRSP